MKRSRNGRASVQSFSGDWPRATPSVPDDPALVRAPHAREIINAQIVQSIIDCIDSFQYDP